MGEQVTALPQEHLVQQGLRLGEGHGLAAAHVLEPPARRRVRHEHARLRVDQRSADVPEVERLADPGAYLAQDLGVRGLTGDAGRHGEQLLERTLVPRRVRRFAHRLDGEGRMVDERDENLEVVVGRAPAADRLVDRDDAEQEAPVVAHRNEERVLRIPGIGMAGPPSLRQVARPERVPVDRPGRHDVGAEPLEAVGKEHRPVLAGTRIPEQHRPGLLVPVHGRHLEVVPLGPVDVDRDGAVAEGFADGPRDSVKQRGKILTRPQKTGHLDEAPQR